MKTIETNTERMKSDTGVISDYIINLQNAYNALEQIMGRLASSWEGDAAVRYGELYRQDLDRLYDMIEMMTELNRGTDSAGKKYEQCERQVADIISAIKV